MNDPLVSVIMPAYNVAPFIAAAIDSVLAQTYTRRELIIVDDGSTDGTPEIVRRYGDAVRSFRQANARQAAARNLGLRQAKGELIAFLDADDVWLPEKLNRQVDLIRRNPTLGLIYCKIREIDETGRPLRDCPADLRGNDTVARILLGNYPTIGTGSTALMPRSVLEAVGDFDLELPPCEDTDLLWRIAARYSIDFVDEVLVLYRMHPGNSHRNLERTTRAWSKLYRKALTDPQVRAFGPKFRKQCLERLYYMLAGDHARAGHWAKACFYVLTGSLASPALFLRCIKQVLRRR